MRTVFRAVLAVSTCLAVPLTAAAQQPARHTLQGTDVVLYNLAGQVRIEAGSGNDVVVEVTAGGADASRLRVESGRIGTRDALRVIYPENRIVYRDGNSNTTLRVRDDGTFGGDSRGGRRVDISTRGNGVEAFANLRVLVPPGKRVRVHLAVGRVDANGVTGDLDIDVHGAPVTARGIRGSLWVDSGSGDVDVADITGDLSLDTGSGEVRVTNATGSRHEIDTGSGGVTVNGLTGERVVVDVGSGNIEARGIRASTIRLDSGSGSVDAELGEGVRDLVIDTGSGNVTVRLPKSFGAEIEVDTGSGRIRTGFPIVTQELRRDVLRGRIGDGSARVRIDTGSGSVELLQM